MIPQWVLAVILSALASTLSGLAMWMLRRTVSRIDAVESRIDGAFKRLHSIDLQIAKELPSKEDFVELKRDMQSFAATMHEIRDMVIRLEERDKSRA